VGSPSVGAWATEQGPNGGDEIDILAKGGDYGWPLVSRRRVYRVSPNPTLEGTVQPIVFGAPSIAVTGMRFYQGEVFTGWRRNAFVGGLREGEVPARGRSSESSSTSAGKRSAVRRYCAS
jgi:glucose/arabinose dehydrogenase